MGSPFGASSRRSASSRCSGRKRTVSTPRGQSRTRGTPCSSRSDRAALDGARGAVGGAVHGADPPPGGGLSGAHVGAGVAGQVGLVDGDGGDAEPGGGGHAADAEDEGAGQVDHVGAVRDEGGGEASAGAGRRVPGGSRGAGGRGPGRPGTGRPCPGRCRAPGRGRRRAGGDRDLRGAGRSGARSGPRRSHRGKDSVTMTTRIQVLSPRWTCPRHFDLFPRGRSHERWAVHPSRSDGQSWPSDPQVIGVHPAGGRGPRRRERRGRPVRRVSRGRRRAQAAADRGLHLVLLGRIGGQAAQSVPRPGVTGLGVPGGEFAGGLLAVPQAFDGEAGGEGVRGRWRPARGRRGHAGGREAVSR